MPPIIDAAEHAWVIHNPRFAIDPAISSCPNGRPQHEQSAEDLIDGMNTYGVDKIVLSHPCYYGRDNAYTSHCIATYPERFAGIGLLIGHRLHPPTSPQNPKRLERAIKEEHLTGMRLSPIYDPDVAWLNDSCCYPLWKKAEELSAVFNIFLRPHQINQVADMAARFPGVDIVIDHIAMIDITRPDSEGFGPLLDLQQYPNVHIRTSLHNPSREKPPFYDMWPYLERLYDAYGPRRLIYANLYELLIMKDLIPFFTSEDKEWILGGTAEKIYFKDRS